MYLRSDIEAIKGEVRALAKTFDYEIEAKEYPAPKGSPEWQAALTAFKIHRKSLCDARLTVRPNLLCTPITLTPA